MSEYNLNCTYCERPLTEVSNKVVIKSNFYICHEDPYCPSHEDPIYVADCHFCDNKVKLNKNSTEGKAVACFEHSYKFMEALK